MKLREKCFKGSLLILLMLCSWGSLSFADYNDPLLDSLTLFHGSAARGLLSLNLEERETFYSRFRDYKESRMVDFFSRILRDPNLNPLGELNMIYRDLSAVMEKSNRKLKPLDYYVMKSGGKYALSIYSSWNSSVRSMIKNIFRYASVTDNPEVVNFTYDLWVELRYRMKHEKKIADTAYLVALNNSVIEDLDHLTESQPLLTTRATNLFAAMPRKCFVLFAHLFY